MMMTRMTGVIALVGLSCLILRLKLEGEGWLSLNSFLLQCRMAGTFLSQVLEPWLDPSGLARFKLANLFCWRRAGECVLAACERCALRWLESVAGCVVLEWLFSA